MQTRLNHGIQPFLVQGTQLAPSSRTLEVFAIGAPRLVHTPLKPIFWRGLFRARSEFFLHTEFSVLGLGPLISPILVPVKSPSGLRNFKAIKHNAHFGGG